MSKKNKALSIITALTLAFCSITVAADVNTGILTLEEAKSLALKNNVQYNMQQYYIDQAKENYQEALDDSSGNSAGKNIAAKASAAVSEDVAVENAASAVRKAVFNRDDMKRSSDYSVTEAYYNAVNAKQSLEDAASDLEQKKTELETARIKYSLELIPGSSLFQAESACSTSQISYNKAASELQVSFMKLSKSIGEELDASKCMLEVAFSAPDPKTLELNKIKEGYLQNNSTYFNAREQYKLAEFKLQETEQEYDDSYDKMKNSTAAVRDQLEDMMYDARKSFDEAKYSYELKLSDMDTTINNQYSSLINLYESYQNQKKEYDDEKLAFEENNLKYQMGLVSKTVLESSRASLSKLEHQLSASIMSLNLQYLNLKQYSL